MFTPADRREIQGIKQSIATLEERHDIHAELVQMNATLKLLVEKHSGMTPAEEAAATAQLNKISDKLDSTSNQPS